MLLLHTECIAKSHILFLQVWPEKFLFISQVWICAKITEINGQVNWKLSDATISRSSNVSTLTWLCSLNENTFCCSYHEHVVIAKVVNLLNSDICRCFTYCSGVSWQLCQLAAWILLQVTSRKIALPVDEKCRSVEFYDLKCKRMI